MFIKHNTLLTGGIYPEGFEIHLRYFLSAQG